MARTARPPIELVTDVALDEENLRSTQNHMDLLHSERETRVRAVAAQIGYQLPADCADPDLIQRDIAANMRRSVEACLEVGRGLQVLKAACAHGQFVARLEVLGLEERVAQRFMQTAAKFAHRAAPMLKAIGNQSKLFEMLILEDEELDALELTGQSGELALDDVATMSVKELRKALRETRETVTAKEQVMASKDAKINDLSTQLARQPRVQAVTPDEEARELRQEVVGTAYELEGRLQGTLRKAFTDLQALGERSGEDHRAFKAALVRNLEVTLMAIRSEFHLPELHPDTLPGWHTLLGLDHLVEG